MRAVAIIPVVFYHAGVPGFSGGLLGVDVFFVVSGYLITRILAAQLSVSGCIAFADFYERRARRIVPAMIPVLAFSTIAAWAVMNAEDFRHFARSLGAAALFGSNVWFALRSNYFGADEAALPMLHTWSLGVEEQYYIAYPLALALCWRVLSRRHILPAVAAAGFLSILLMWWLAVRQPSWAFFLMPTRLWELLAGAACALLPIRRPSGIWAWIGLLLLTGGFIAGAGAQQVGPHMLLPVAGTALLLLGGSAASFPGRALSWRPLVAIGLASYGTYLWHLPLIGFARYLWFGPLGWLATTGLIAVSFGLGWISFLLIERPIRARARLGTRPAIAIFSAASLALFALIAIAGAKGAITPRQGVVDDALGSRFPGDGVERNVIPHNGKPLDFVLYGDSHARQYFSAFSAKLGQGALVSDDGCLSLPGLSSIDPGNTDPCRDQFASLARLLAQRPAPVVILAHLWQRDAWPSDQRSAEHVPDPVGHSAFARAVDRAIAALPPQSTVVIIGHVPAARPAGAPQMAKGYTRCLRYLNVTCPTSIARSEAEGTAINRILAAASARSGRAIFIDPADALCSRSRCAIVERGTLLYSDENHVSREGARRIAELMARKMHPYRALAIPRSHP